MGREHHKEIVVKQHWLLGSLMVLLADHLYSVFGLPVSVVIDRDGNISRVVIGGLFQDEVDDFIGEILN